MFSNFLNLANVIEQMSIQHFITISSVESFDEGILVWLSWLNVSDVYILGLRPIHKLLRSHFRSVIQANCLWLAVVVDQAFQRT